MMYYRGIGGLNRCVEGGLGYMGGGAGGFLMMALMVILTVLAVVFIITLLRKNRESAANGKSSEAMILLNERFAKGEITEEEYSRMKKVLRT